MRQVETVLGSKEVSELGIIDPHEHIFVNLQHQYLGKKKEYTINGDRDKVGIENIGALRRNCYLIKDNLVMDSLETAIEELGHFKDEKGETIIDLTLPGIGRDVEKLKKASEETGVHIIAASGTYTYDTIPLHLQKMDVKTLAEYFIVELTRGIGKSDIKAGIIGEMGTSETIHPLEEKGLKAAAIAHKETGAKIVIHTYPWGEEALKVLDILTNEGVEGTNVCICHLDVLVNESYMQAVLDRGAYLEFDDFGKEFYMIKQPGEFAGGAFATDIERIEAVRVLCDKGYSSQVLLANDVCLKSLLHKYGGWGYDHVLHNIIPMMCSEGIDEACVEKLIVENPKAFLM